MSVDIKVAGSNLSPAGRQYWAHDTTIGEDASPTSLSDSFGGVGSVSASAETLDGALYNQGAELAVTFTPGGTRAGIITEISDNAGVVGFTASTLMGKLNRVINAPVIKTTLGDALKQYFGLAGLSLTQYAIDAGVAARPLLLPGWSGNAWQKLKELEAIEQIDFNEVDGVIQVSPRDLNREISLENAQAPSLSLTENVSGRNVETHFYEYVQIANSIVYPPATFDSSTGYTSAPGFHRDMEVISVTPGSPVVVEVELMASLTSVQQPVCVKEPPGPNYVGPSCYTVLTKDGVEPIDPDEWYARGGSVKVEILPSTTTLRITVDAGDNIFAAAPFRLCVSTGSTDYSTLRIMGTGLSISKTRIRQATTTPIALTDQDTASSTDSIFCRTQDQARKMLMEQSREASRSGASLSAQLGHIDTPIGLRAGAVVRRPEGVYRVRSASTSVNGISLTGAPATRLRDLKEAWAGKTLADLKATWTGYMLRNFATAPLRQSLPPAPSLPALTGYGFGPYGSGPYGG